MPITSQWYPGPRRRTTARRHTRFVTVLAIFSIGLIAGLLALCGCSRVSGDSPTPAVLDPKATRAIVATSSPEPTSARLLSPTITMPTATPVLSDSSVLATVTPEPFFEGPVEYGRSFGGRPLYLYRLGTGPSARLVVGGIHGGYEWNTVELVSETLAYYQANAGLIPASVTFYIVPCANPDGYVAGTDAEVARMNGNLVDLNRNWDYQWQPTATHGTRPVRAGSRPFSEPETDALRRLIEERAIEAVIFYHSAYGGVVFSGAKPERSATYELAEMLAEAISYRHQVEGVPGQITTGDAIDWLSAERGIAGAEIELTTHSSVLGTDEYSRNLRGLQAFLEWPLPLKGEATLGASTDDTYTVQEGDTISQIIGKLFGVDALSPLYDELLEQILAMNEIDDANEIQIGQVLRIPSLPRDD